MIIKSAVTIDPTYGCDHCGQEIFEHFEDSRLSVDIFYKGKEDPKRLDFCSWSCLFKHVPKMLKSRFDFIALPFLSETKNEKSNRSAKAFLKEIKK